MDDNDWSGLWGDSPEATLEMMEEFVRDRMMKDRGLWAIEHWNESSMQNMLFMKFLADGVDVEYEKGTKRGADLFVVEGDRRIVLELKYAQVSTLVMPRGPRGEKPWKRRDRTQAFLEDAESVWDLEFKPYNKLDKTTFHQFFIDNEMEKMKSTSDHLDATDFYVLMGVGHVFAIEKVEF